MIKDKLIEDFLSYSLEANTRSTVDIRDGLKPVHRRVLYDMKEVSKASKDFVGSAKIVGDTLGSFHPHSDASVYDAAVRLAQPFKTRYPLIEFSGNYGSIAEPSKWAHQRYTKMRISAIGNELLNNIDKETVEFIETYNGEGMEPVNLPSLLPITLLNGTLGIGVGMASSLPPHNLNEVLSAAEALIANPDLTTKGLMRYIKGPDFPTGNQIINPEDLLNAYETGSGSVKLRAQYSIQNKNGRTSIMIQEVPFLIDPNTRIIAVIKEMYEEGEYEYIDDIINHTGKDNPFKLEIILKKDAPVYQVLEKLHKETGIETSYTINNTVYLGNNKFKRLSLKELLQAYIDSCYDILLKVAQYDLRKAKDRLEIVEGLLRAVVLIEEIVPVIRSSKNTADAAVNLQAKWAFTDRQVKAILDMKLSRLTNLDENKLKSEKEELINKINELEQYISDKNLQTTAIIQMYQNFKKKFGDPRRTRIQSDTDIAEGESKVFHLFLTEEGNFYSVDELPSNRRNTKGKKMSRIVAMQKVTASDTLYIYTENAVLHQINAMALYTGGENSEVNGITLFDSKPVGFLPWEEKDYLLTLSKNGKLKKSEASEYKEGKSNTLCKLADNDLLQEAWFVNDDDLLLAITAKNKYIAFAAQEVRVSSRYTQGSSAVTEDFLSFTLVKDFALMWDSDSKGKLVRRGDLKPTPRRGTGLVANGAVGAVGVDNKEVILVQSQDDRGIFINTTSISAAQPSATGVAILNGEIAKILLSKNLK